MPEEPGMGTGEVHDGPDFRWPHRVTELIFERLSDLWESLTDYAAAHFRHRTMLVRVQVLIILAGITYLALLWIVKGAVAGAAAMVSTTPLLEAQSNGTAAAPSTGLPAPTQAQINRESENVRPPVAVRTITRPGSDLMVQVRVWPTFHKS